MADKKADWVQEFRDPTPSSLRDQLAGQALIALLAVPLNPGVRPNPDELRAHIADEAYKMADAMLKARNG